MSGGSSTLIVTVEWDEGNERHTASHTAAEICEHVRNGGVALAYYGEMYHHLNYAYEDGSYVEFVSIEWGLSASYIVIDDSNDIVDLGYESAVTDESAVYLWPLLVIRQRNGGLSIDVETIFNYAANQSPVFFRPDSSKQIIYPLTQYSPETLHFGLSSLYDGLVYEWIINRDGTVEYYEKEIGGSSGILVVNFYYFSELQANNRVKSGYYCNSYTAKQMFQAIENGSIVHGIFHDIDNAFEHSAFGQAKSFNISDSGTDEVYFTINHGGQYDSQGVQCLVHIADDSGHFVDGNSANHVSGNELWF